MKGKAVNAIESELLKAGYNRSPNKIYSDIPWTPEGNSPIWYAGGPGLPEPRYGQEVEVAATFIRVFKPRLDLTTMEVAVFDNVPAFLAWCQANGQISEPGLPAFSNSWD